MEMNVSDNVMWSGFAVRQDQQHTNLFLSTTIEMQNLQYSWSNLFGATASMLAVAPNKFD